MTFRGDGQCNTLTEAGHFVLTVRKKFQEDTGADLAGVGLNTSSLTKKAGDLNNHLHTHECVSSTKFKS